MLSSRQGTRNGVTLAPFYREVQALTYLAQIDTAAARAPGVDALWQGASTTTPTSRMPRFTPILDRMATHRHARNVKYAYHLRCGSPFVAVSCRAH
jgi:hypothetical protein